MSLIHVLTQDITNKIAAGEVVERPASVVKELVENSIDAGADKITVEIQNGGVKQISVTDNGCGMAKEDAEIAFLRHATSKIKCEEDLDAIYTLGFRGEALSSIGAVSKAELFTKRSEDSTGTLVTCEGGEIIASEESGMADGTRLVVNNLFYNTPARMKFLKKDATEASYIHDLMVKFILAHPEISFKFIKNGKEALFSLGDGVLGNAVYTVYGKDYAKALIDVQYTSGGISVTGAVGKGNMSRPNRAFQSFFVNGRNIKSPLITKAVEEAYKNQIMIGKFPVAILNIQIHPSFIDINVHPTKLEVKFSDEKQIYDAVYFAVKNALYAVMNVPEISKKERPQEKPAFLQKEGGTVTNENQLSLEKPVRPEVVHRPSEFKNLFKITPRESLNASILKGQKSDINQGITNKDESHVLKVSSPMPAFQIEESDKPSKAEAAEKTEKGNDYLRIVGQVFDTYIIAQRGNDVLFIDQHAAHERIKYEALLRNLEGKSVYPQILLEPAIVRLNASELSAFEEAKAFLNELGFDADVFGENEVIIRTSPADVSAGDVEDLFVELIGCLMDNKKEILTAKRERMLYTIACKAAIKANHDLTLAEMESLVREVLKMDNINTCPHGRPIMIKMSKKEMEKNFKRIV